MKKLISLQYFINKSQKEKYFKCFGRKLMQKCEEKVED